MKTLGLIGGMSWESTALYYSIINQEIKQRLGGLHSAQLLLYSFDFADIASLQQAGKWAMAFTIDQPFYKERMEKKFGVEIGLLIQEDSCHDVPMFDTTHLHARGAAVYALQP